jgi:HlyD family secretion protein
MRRIAVLLVVVAAVAVSGWFAYQQGWFTSSLGDVSAEASQAVREVAALGRLEPSGKVIDIGAIPGERLLSLLVEEGQTVAKDAPLAYLESRSLRELNLESLNAQRSETFAHLAAEEDLAEVRIATAQLGVKQAKAQQLAINAQRKKVDFLKATWELAKSDQQRLAGLDKNLVSDQDRDHQKLVVDKAQTEYLAEKALLEKAEQTFDLGVAAAEADLRAAEAGKRVVQAAPRQSIDKGIELAQEQLKQSTLSAPSPGTILKIQVRPGEILGPLPVMQMANLEKMVAVAEVYETDLKRVRLGQEAVLSSAAFPAPYDARGLHGKVVEIGKVVTSPGIKSLDPLAKTDRHVVEVRVELDAQSNRVAAALTNLQVDVRLLAPK